MGVPLVLAPEAPAWAPARTGAGPASAFASASFSTPTRGAGRGPLGPITMFGFCFSWAEGAPGTLGELVLSASDVRCRLAAGAADCVEEGDLLLGAAPSATARHLDTSTAAAASTLFVSCSNVKEKPQVR